MFVVVLTALIVRRVVIFFLPKHEMLQQNMPHLYSFTEDICNKML